MKVVIIGLGSIGKKHVDALMQIEEHNFDIYALRSSMNKTKTYKNVNNIYSLEVLPFEPDFFIISNPTFLHFQTLQTLILFEKPLLIEKPAVMLLKEAAIIEPILRKKNILNYVGCNLRFLEVLTFSKDFLRKKNLRINEVNIYAGSYLPSWRPSQNFREVYSANAKMGGGIHLDFIHEIDYLYWFFGKPKMQHSILRNNSSLEISAIDYANYSYVYNEFVASVVLNYYRKDRKRTFEIVAEEGTLLIEVEKGKVFFKQELIFQTDQSILDTYFKQMRYFVNCIKSNEKTMNTFSEAFEVLQMCLDDE
ncbi:Gfo/Idh/MocA family oxidoreductase [Aureispira sp. CCB-E]|uniref:Gfo/Idh/MocA family protein n=1 Tax=Aureispira sp. CCB-E TaxID=3051121 RepID=UPI0028695D79|nr:Gfo/Idh/MocA family oxidoreductase [Aureispira sp. CCB-E]WMX16020.1 Gfo/Idh/MocA family oxidoreductase [Aureispira sp. CCB-E]